MAAITMMPKSAAKMLSKALAYAEFSTIFPLPLPIGPKLSDATQRKEKIVHARKYMYVERLLKRNLSSKVKNSQKSVISDPPDAKCWVRSSNCEPLITKRVSSEAGAWTAATG